MKIRKGRKPAPPKPGATVRLKGAAMEALRRAVFERDGYRCQHILFWTETMRGYDVPEKCNRPVTWDSGHLAHIVSRGRGGADTAENCVTKCQTCHIQIEHGFGPSGVKPCPAK